MTVYLLFQLQMKESGLRVPLISLQARDSVVFLQSSSKPWEKMQIVVGRVEDRFSLRVLLSS